MLVLVGVFKILVIIEYGVNNWIFGLIDVKCNIKNYEYENLNGNLVLFVF